MRVDGFIEERRGRARILVRSDLAETLRVAGVDDPRVFLDRTTVIRTYRGRARASLVAVDSAGGEIRRLVLRVYRHGGVAGGVLGGLFWRGDRAREELVALEAARSARVAVARPVAAVCRRVGGLLYRAHLVTEEVDGARDLVAWLEARQEGRDGPDPAVVFQAVGAAMRRLHDAGIDLPDLHVKNVLVTSDGASEPVLIDFDRARVAPRAVGRARRLRDLFRFDRSVEKLGRRGPGVARRERARLFRGYAAGDRIPRDERRSACRRYRFHLALHRLGWRLRGR